MTSPKDAIPTNDGRFYERHGRRYISVTNVIEKAISKPALLPWASKLTAEAALEDFKRAQNDPEFRAHLLNFPDTTEVKNFSKLKKAGRAAEGNPASEWKRRHVHVKDESADRGSLIHEWAEGWVLGTEPDPPPGLETECLGIMQAFKKYGITPLVAESTVYNNTHDYAGTVDLFATVEYLGWDGVISVLDYKTGNNVWPETALQLAAYRFGEYIGLPDDSDVPVPQVQRAGVLHVGHTETRLVPYRAGTGEFTVFLNALYVARFVIEEAGNVIGEIV